MLRTRIHDGAGRGADATVTRNRAVLVATRDDDVPPSGTPNVRRWFSQSLADDTSSISMNVDGSVTPQEFYYSAEAGNDIVICRAVILIEDTDIGKKGKFGNQPALAVGWDLIAEETASQTYIVQKAQSSADLQFWSGEGGKVQKVDWTTSTKAQLVVLDITAMMGGSGIRIGHGTADRIVAVVNDDLTALADMQVRLMGYRHFKTSEE